MKPLHLSLSILAAAFTTLYLIPRAESEPGWSHVYRCQEFTITLREMESEQFSYDAKSQQGNLYLDQGTRQNTGRSWIYRFVNANTTYEIEDIWGRGTRDRGVATLRVTQNNREILFRNCRK